MKIAQVTYSADNSSICANLNEELNKLGVASDIVTINTKLEGNIVTINEKIINRIVRHVRYLVEKIFLRVLYKKDVNAIFDISNYGVPRYQIENVFKDYDVINFHYINGMISYSEILNISKSDKRVFWTMHDCWAFTGGCHHGCDRYQHNCGSCYILNSKDNNDISKNNIEKKKNTYGQSSIVIISPSSWMDAKVGSSSVFENNKHLCILNGVDLNTFKPFPRIKGNKYVLLAGAVSPKASPFKGYEKLVDIMKTIAVRYPQNLNTIKLVFFGSCSIDDVRYDFDSRIEIETLGYIKDRKELAKVYSMSDVFLSTSVIDNLPTTIIEAAACGTPTVAFDVGGISDIILNDVTGKLISNFDIDKYADSIIQIISSPGDMRVSCRKRMEERFSITNMAQNYLHLYQEICD